jgi:hypothetical protein
LRDFANLVVSDVVELQDDDVTLTAVHARMSLEVLCREFPQQFTLGRVALRFMTLSQTPESESGRDASNPPAIGTGGGT